MATVILMTAAKSTNFNPTPVSATLADRVTARSATVKTTQHALRWKYLHLWIPPTNFTASWDETWRWYAYRSYQSTWSYQITSPNFLPASVSGMNEGTHINNSYTRARENLKDQKVNYSQAIAESQQVGRLVASSATRMARSIEGLIQGVRAVKKGKLSKAKKEFKKAAAHLGVTKKKWKLANNVSQHWLELQYGWKPLLSDISGAMDGLVQQHKADPQRCRWTVGGTSGGKDVKRYTVNTGASHETFLRTQTISVRTKLTYTIDSNTNALLSNIGISNPLNLAWELTPFSFVADWFIPVGDYFNTLDADLGYNFLGGHTTVRYLDTHIGERYWVDGITINVKSLAKQHTKSIRRFVHLSSPMPRFPGFKNPLSFTHVANALALLTAAVTKGKSPVH